MNKLIINLTTTGVIPTKDMTKHVPITPSEIIEDVYKCYQLGAQMVHVHVRDENGKNTLDPKVYAQVIKEIRKKCHGMIICASLSGRVMNTIEARSAVLDLEGNAKPDMGSLTLSSMNFMQNESVNNPEMILGLLKKMNQKGIKPELEVFDVGMVNFSKYLIKKELLKPPFYYNILLGNIYSAQVEWCDIAAIVNALPEGAYYCFAGLGQYQKKANALGVIMASGVRVGLEDNIHYDDERKILATNEMLVKRIVDLCKIYGRDIASVEEVREMLELR